MKRNVTHVIHNAWRVDFNLALTSFEQHIAGTRRLVDVCYSMPHAGEGLFTSSVAAAQDWAASRGPVPEAVLSEHDAPTSTGYGASKFVAEHVSSCTSSADNQEKLTQSLQVLDQARRNGLECTSLRIGQICGSKSTGAWGTTEWIPIIVKSSLALSMLPDLDGVCLFVR